MDLREFVPDDGPFDFIIAHGFLSWVPDDVKAALFSFCRNHLTSNGVATVSCNVESGWSPRFPVIRKTRAILQAGAEDLVSALGILRSVTDSESPEIPIIDDMLAKGPSILLFDDFGPVNDPWSLDRFVHSAEEKGLRWLGESDPGSGETASSQLENLQAKDVEAGRTFRSSMLCLASAPVTGGADPGDSFGISIRSSGEIQDSADQELRLAIDTFAPSCVALREVRSVLKDWDESEFVSRVLAGIRSGWILPRIEPLQYDPSPPAFPQLDSFRLLCASERLPLVDAWLKPCQFPERHYQVLATMDGSRSRDDIAEFSKSNCPELAFHPWLRHLASRGMFT